ncbi:MAG: sialate O-acetylesterase, partial [Saprospiraceae bacterium]|nr:sialate O-acetylesterase [Saprospiraceae bacterium]
ARLPIKGVIWYQGESNAGRAWQYREAFPLLIRDWRRLWGSEFPFLFVQLANWEAGKGDANTGSDWAELREAQALTLQLPRTGMAVTIDIGESKDIHPKNKHDVGLRLAHEARRIAYGENLAPGSPPPPRVQFSADTAYAYFELPAPGLMVRDSAGAAQGFELAGEDRVFHPAQAVVEGATIRAWSAAVPKPLALRYAWADDPQGLNVYTREGFPLAPFRSDDWPCKTRDGRFE